MTDQIPAILGNAESGVLGGTQGMTLPAAQATTYQCPQNVSGDQGSQPAMVKFSRSADREDGSPTAASVAVAAAAEQPHLVRRVKSAPRILPSGTTVVFAGVGSEDLTGSEFRRLGPEGDQQRVRGGQQPSQGTLSLPPNPPILQLRPVRNHQGSHLFRHHPVQTLAECHVVPPQRGCPDDEPSSQPGSRADKAIQLPMGITWQLPAEECPGVEESGVGREEPSGPLLPSNSAPSLPRELAASFETGSSANGSRGGGSVGAQARGLRQLQQQIGRISSGGVVVINGRPVESSTLQHRNMTSQQAAPSPAQQAIRLASAQPNLLYVKHGVRMEQMSLAMPPKETSAPAGQRMGPGWTPLGAPTNARRPVAGIPLAAGFGCLWEAPSLGALMQADLPP